MKNNLNVLRHFISQNVNPPEKGFVSKFWPREVKIAKELFLKFPNEKFWGTMVIGFKVNSLAYFKMKSGDDLLKQKYLEFNYVPPKKQETILELSDRKFGETLHNVKAPRTVRDFLN